MHSIKKPLRIGIISLASIIGVIVIFLLTLYLINNPSILSSKEKSAKDLNTVEIDGVKYLPKEGVLNILIFGVDDDETIPEENYRNSAVADFICILTINKNTESISCTMVNRDTITAVKTYSITGEYVGTINTQIGLSHTWGNGGLQSSKNVCDAVSSLMYKVKFDAFIKLYIKSVPTLIDSLCGNEGLKIKLATDWSSINPSWTKDTEVYMNGEECKTYVQARQGYDDGTNISRMKRQSAFISAFINKIASLPDNYNYLSLMENTKECFYTELNSRDMIDLFNFAINYPLNSFYQYDGTSIVDTVVYYYPDYETIKAIVKEVFYDERTD